jgi:hypothetical protein
MPERWRDEAFARLPELRDEIAAAPGTGRRSRT